MRRDLFHYYEKDVASVYSAYAAAAKQRFGKDCREEPFHTLSFGLNYSFKYNMNGGACTVHFIRYNTGTAVNIRYSIAQLYGARYGAHDRDLSSFVTDYLKVPVADIALNSEMFLNEQNKVYAYSPAPPAAQPVIPVQQPTAPIQQPTAPAAQPVINKFCGKCGAELAPGALFCGRCGNKIQ